MGTSDVLKTDHFTVVCLVIWPLNESEAGVDLVLIGTSLLFLRKFQLISTDDNNIINTRKVGGLYHDKVNLSHTFI